MKFNISYPLTGAQKTVEIDDDKKCSIFYDKRMGQTVEADNLGDEYKGYIFKITGGNDKQGFPMRQGVLFKGRVRILMRKGHSGYRPRKTGEVKRKSARGCIVGQDIRVLSLAIVKKGDAEIEGVTNNQQPRRLGPKRLSKLRRLFGFKKTDGVEIIQKNIIRRTWTTKDGKKRQKAPKIQRIITSARLRRKVIAKKRAEVQQNKMKAELKAYKALVHDIKEKKKKHRKASADIKQEQQKPQAPVQTQKKDVKGGAKQGTKAAPTKQAPVATTGKQATKQATKAAPTKQAPVATTGKQATKQAPKKK